MVIALDKKEYIIRQLARTKNKKYEQYVVTRIVTLINDLDIKFVTQQYVSRPEGRALTDLFFPQLDMHIEVDELHHKLCVNADKIREADIVNATNHEIKRIDIEKSIENINLDIDKLVLNIKEKVKSLKDSGEFVKWDVNSEYNPETYIEKGYIDVADDVKFRTIKDACNCFGNNYKGFQKGLVRHPEEDYTSIWFPALNPIAEEPPKVGDWDNRISQDEEIITTEHLTDLSRNDKQLESINNEKKFNKRVIFVKVKDNLGMMFYRFRGLYKLSAEESASRGIETWVRVSKRVKTYPHDANKQSTMAKLPAVQLL